MKCVGLLNLRCYAHSPKCIWTCLCLGGLLWKNVIKSLVNSILLSSGLLGGGSNKNACLFSSPANHCCAQPWNVVSLLRCCWFKLLGLFCWTVAPWSTVNQIINYCLSGCHPLESIKPHSEAHSVRMAPESSLGPLIRWLPQHDNMLPFAPLLRKATSPMGPRAGALSFQSLLKWASLHLIFEAEDKPSLGYPLHFFIAPCYFVPCASFSAEGNRISLCLTLDEHCDVGNTMWHLRPEKHR